MDSCHITFNPRPKIDIVGDESNDYYIEIYEYRNNIKELIIDFRLKTNNFISYLREWYGDYQIDVYNWNDDNGMFKIFEHRFNDEGKKVLINLDTYKTNEALIWLDRVIEYRDLHKCILYVKSPFKEDIKEIDKTIKVVDNINDNDYYAIYNIGKYDTEHEWNKDLTDDIYNFILAKNLTYCSYRNPRDWHNLSLDDVAADILGINKI